MLIDLDTYDLIRLVLGVGGPPYELFDHPLIKISGRYIGGFHDSWQWEKHRLRTLSDEQLLEIYRLCKNEHIEYYKSNGWEVI